MHNKRWGREPLSRCMYRTECVSPHEVIYSQLILIYICRKKYGSKTERYCNSCEMAALGLHSAHLQVHALVITSVGPWQLTPLTTTLSCLRPRGNPVHLWNKYLWGKMRAHYWPTGCMQTKLFIGSTWWKVRTGKAMKCISTVRTSLPMSPSTDRSQARGRSFAVFIMHRFEVALVKVEAFSHAISSSPFEHLHEGVRTQFICIVELIFQHW